METKKVNVFIRNESKNVKRDSQKKACIRFIIVFITLLIIPSIASAARERYVLDFGDTFIRSYHKEPATIFLKRTLKEQYPGVNIRDMDLRKVVVVAKTKMGLGGAELRVGRNRTHNQQVYGNPRDFNDHRRYTFDRVRFRNPSKSSRGPWQIDLRGNFIVRKIVLVVDEHRDYRPHRRHGRDYRHYKRHHHYRDWRW